MCDISPFLPMVYVSLLSFASSRRPVQYYHPSNACPCAHLFDNLSSRPLRRPLVHDFSFSSLICEAQDGDCRRYLLSFEWDLKHRQPSLFDLCSVYTRERHQYHYRGVFSRFRSFFEDYYSSKRPSPCSSVLSTFLFFLSVRSVSCSDSSSWPLAISSATLFSF